MEVCTWEVKMENARLFDSIALHDRACEADMLGALHLSCISTISPN